MLFASFFLQKEDDFSYVQTRIIWFLLSISELCLDVSRALSCGLGFGKLNGCEYQYLASRETLKAHFNLSDLLEASQLEHFVLDFSNLQGIS